THFLFSLNNMSNKRRQRHFVISHSANKKPRYSHNSGLELVSSSEDDTDPSSSIAPSISRGSSCPRCMIFNNKIKWLCSRIEKYEESMQARINKLERLLALGRMTTIVDLVFLHLILRWYLPCRKFWRNNRFFNGKSRYFREFRGIGFSRDVHFFRDFIVSRSLF